MTVTIVIRDDSAFISVGLPSERRTVRFDLTDEQERLIGMLGRHEVIEMAIVDGVQTMPSSLKGGAK